MQVQEHRRPRATSQYVQETEASSPPTCQHGVEDATACQAERIFRQAEHKRRREGSRNDVRSG